MHSIFYNVIQYYVYVYLILLWQYYMRVRMYNALAINAARVFNLSSHGRRWSAVREQTDRK